MGGKGSNRAGMAMVGLQFIYATVALFTRSALVEGLSPMVFVVYRHAVATLILFPISYFYRRKNSSVTSIGTKGFLWIFLTSLGVTGNQTGYFQGLYLTSSSTTSAMVNLQPGVTFLVTSIIGLEKFNIRSLKSVAKFVGTVICVGGAICIALLKGPQLFNPQLLPENLTISPQEDKWLLGCLYLLASTIFGSLWLVMQVPVTANCPDHLYTSSWMCFLTTVDTATVTLLLGHTDLGSWKPASSLQMFCCLYSGGALAISFFVQTWCVSQRGPLFCAMFTPLTTVIVTFFGVLWLHEKTYLGGLLGAVGVITGLYMVLWGKSEDFQDSNAKIDQTCCADYRQVLIHDNHELQK